MVTQKRITSPENGIAYTEVCFNFKIKNLLTDTEYIELNKMMENLLFDYIDKNKPDTDIVE